LFSCLLSAFVFVPSLLSGQDLNPGVQEAYFRAVAEHFKVPLEEVAIIADWEMDADEVPVVLFLSSRAGVPPDALIGLRRSGRPWREVARQFGLGVGVFHVSLPQDAALGSLTRACEEFRSRHSREWDQIELTDAEVVSLVNLRFLSKQVGVPPVRVLHSREEAGSFVGGFASLIGRTYRTYRR
jgi:hypothetical protein